MAQALVLQARRDLLVRREPQALDRKCRGVHPDQGLLSQAQQRLVLANGAHNLLR